MKYAAQPATSGKPACGGGGAGALSVYDLGFCGSGFSGSGGANGAVGEVGDNGVGGGGGGGGCGNTNLTTAISGGTGGSGGVVLRFASGVTPASTTGSPTIYNDGTNKHYIYSGNGSITF
jgi:hypothetical protein